MAKSNLERLFLTWWHLLAPNAPEPVPEHRFHPIRRWRFDFCWPDSMIALELDGGTWTRGRHTRGAGYRGDCEKLNAAASMGYRVFRITAGMLKDNTADVIEMVREAL